MSFIFERVIRETLEVEIVKRNYVPYRAFSRIRQDKTTCGFCQQPFQLNDMLHIAFVKSRQNELICNDCAENAIQGGAKESVQAKTD